MAAQTITQRIALTGGAEIRKELEALGKDGEAAFKKLQEAAANLKGPESSFAQGLKDASASLKTVGAVLDEAGKKISALGKTFSTFVTAPIVAAGAAGVKAFADFDSAMAQVASQVDLTKESLADIGNEIRQLSTRTPVGLNDLVKAFEEIRSSGISAADGMKVLEGAAKLAVAAQTDVVTAADAATSAINAFGLKGQDQARVFDLLFRAVDSGKITLAELGDSFGKISGTIRSSNIQLDEYLIALSVLSRTGSSASESQRSLNSVLDRLNTKSKDTADTLKKLGAQSFAQLVQRSGGLVQAFKSLVESAHGSNAELLKIFGTTQAVGAVLALVGPQFSAFSTELSGVRSGASKVDEQFQRMRGTVKATFAELGNQLTDAAIDIGAELIPAVKGVVEAIQGIVKSFKDLPDGAKTAIVAFAAIVAAIGPVLFVVGKFITIIGKLAIASSVLVDGLIILGGALAALSAPAIGIIALVAAVAAAFVYLATRQTDAQRASEQHKVAMTQLAGAIDGIKAGVPGAAANFKELAKSNYDAAAAAVTNAKTQLKAVDDIANAYLKAGRITAPQAVQSTAPFVKNVEDTIRQLDELSAEIEKGQAALDESAKKVLTGAADAATTTAEKISTTVAIIRGGSTEIKGHVSGITSEIVHLTDGVNLNIDQVAANLGKVKDGIQGTLTPITGLNDKVKTLGDGILRITDDTGKILLEIDQTVGGIGGSIDKVTQSVAALGAVGQQLVQTTALTSIAEGAQQLVVALDAAADQAKVVSGQITEAAIQASQAWLNLPLSIQTAATSAAGAASQIIVAFQGIGSAIATELGSIGPALSSTFASIVSAIESQLSALSGAVASMVAQMSAQLASLASAIASARAELNSAQSAQGRKGGGMIRGAGTSTSDSILARLSNGEFVVKAAAVRHYGQDLFAALNALRLPSGAFSVGGMASSVAPSRGGVPAFAGGGPVGRPINLTIDGKTFGLQGSTDVAESLGRFVMGKRARASGRKPSWY